jgi:hypothetical protein
LIHGTTPDFWICYEALPSSVRVRADKALKQLKANPRQASLRLKKVGRFWSARVGLHYRALAIESDGGLLWFWIGTHGEYDRLIR